MMSECDLILSIAGNMPSSGTFWRAEVFPRFLVPTLENNSYPAHHLEGLCPVSDVTAILAPGLRMGGDTELQCHRRVKTLLSGVTLESGCFELLLLILLRRRGEGGWGRGEIWESGLSPPAGQRLT